MLLTAIRLGCDEEDSEFKEAWTIFRTLNFTSQVWNYISGLPISFYHKDIMLYVDKPVENVDNSLY